TALAAHPAAAAGKTLASPHLVSANPRHDATKNLARADWARSLAASAATTHGAPAPRHRPGERSTAGRCEQPAPPGRRRSSSRQQDLAASRDGGLSYRDDSAEARAVLDR